MEELKKQILNLLEENTTNETSSKRIIYAPYNEIVDDIIIMVSDNFEPKKCKGPSRIHNQAYKLKARKDAIDIETLAIPCAGSQDNAYKSMMDMVHAVMVLTTDVSYNPEF